MQHYSNTEHFRRETQAEIRTIEIDEAVHLARLAGLDVGPFGVQWTQERGALIQGMPAAAWIDSQTRI